MAPEKIAVFGVPTAAGARGEGPSRAPFVLRSLGLLEALAGDGRRVVNRSDLSLFPYREDDTSPHARNASGVACAVRAAADEMPRALADGFTVLLGGDCTLVVGSLTGLARHAEAPVGLVFLDAHADLHDEATTVSGRIQGMALAIAMGEGPASVREGAIPVRPEHVVLLGVRDWEKGEPERARRLGWVASAAEMRERGLPATAARALEVIGDRPVLVHFDVDVIRAEDMPATEVATPGDGLTLVEAAELLRDLLAFPQVKAIEVVEYDPDRDPDGRHGRRVVDLVTTALSRRL